MKNDLVKGMHLLKYGVSAKANLILMICFILLGIMMEFIASFLDYEFYMNTIGFDMGAVFLFCGAMFPMQMVISIDVGTLTQTSSLKKKLQTSIPSAFMGIGAILALTIVVLIRAVAVWGYGVEMELLRNLVWVSLMGAVLIIYCGFIYKFFIASIVILYLLMMGLGGFSGFLYGMGEALPEFFKAMSPGVSILLAYVILIAAIGLQYGLSFLLYKRPISKYAFSACLRRNT